MLTYLSTWFSDHEALTHAFLIGGSIVGGFVVAVGIIKESPKWSLATTLVVVGVVIEAICTILLFVFDEGISQRQQRTIDAQQKKLAPRIIQDREGMAVKLKPFSGALFSIGIQPGDETLGFFDQLIPILEAAGWRFVPVEGSSSIFNVPGRPAMANIVLRGGISVLISPDRAAQWGDATHALGAAIEAEGIKVFAGVSEGSPTNAIFIRIGTKP